MPLTHIATGIGMSEDYLQHNLFLPFSQVNSSLEIACNTCLQEISSLNNKYRGIGLGLALSKYLIERMDGKIVINSKKGKGTTATIYMPLVQPPITTNNNNSDITAESVSTPSSSSTSKPSLSNMSKTFPKTMDTKDNQSKSVDSTANQSKALNSFNKLPANEQKESKTVVAPYQSYFRNSELSASSASALMSSNAVCGSTAVPCTLATVTALIVDDNSMNRQLLSLTFSDIGFNTLTASSGAEALAIVQQCINGELTHKLDCIVLDIFMPGEYKE